jgi:hypothetical protein
MIKEELDNTISQSATDFEVFLANKQDLEHIASCRDRMAQVGGTFRLLQFPGAALLADEMAALIAVIADPQQKATTAMIEALTHAYFVLPRYIEYVSIKQVELPILVIPYVNELRVSHKAALLPEYHCNSIDIPRFGMMSDPGKEAQLPTLLTTAPRLRHMYQTGLIGVLKDPNSSFHFQFMRRAISRFVSLLGNHPQAEIWKIASAVLEAFVSAKLEITLNRKRMLADIEKMLRLVVSNGEEGLNIPPSENLKKDFLFLLMLTDVSRPEINSIKSSYSLVTLNISDRTIAAERNKMHGPSIDTIESVIKALKDELRNAKDTLEIASQNGTIEAEDLATLKDVVSRVADTLSLLNLQGPQQTLKDQVQRFSGWTNASGKIDSSEFLDAADTILYVESALSGLDRRELSIEDINQASALTRKKIIASSQLAEAQQLVLEEAQAGIALAKRAITSYVDSNFDSAHIANVATTLNTVRGGMHILNYNRAAAVLKSCSAFVNSHIEDKKTGQQRHQLLETLADALISLEYYIAEIENSRNVNEKILDVAEESLAALGFAVNS